ncbi:MAG: ArsR/SmtB family transcription factor [Flavobacteriales bacterium]
MKKVSEFSDLELQLSHYTRAVGHPARIAIIHAMAKRGFRVQGEIIHIPSLSSTTVLQHLRELKRAGIIQGRIFGAKADYYLDVVELKRFIQQFQQFAQEIDPSVR